jgi:hypothetical protein
MNSTITNGKRIIDDYGTVFVSIDEYTHYCDSFIQDGMTPLSWDDYCDMREQAMIDETQSVWCD